MHATGISPLPGLVSKTNDVGYIGPCSSAVLSGSDLSIHTVSRYCCHSRTLSNGLINFPAAFTSPDAA